MDSLKTVLEGIGLPAERGIYTGKDKPDAYFTFQRLLINALAPADDTKEETAEMWRVTLIYRGDFESTLQATIEALEAAGYYINSVDQEAYETDTGYWVIPITIQILKE